MKRYRVAAADVDYYRRNIPCQEACPAHTDARGYIQAILQGDYQRGYQIARLPNPFASACGRVCLAPCEEACRRGKLDAPIAIRALKRFLTQKYGVEGERAGVKDGSHPPDNALTWESVPALKGSSPEGQGKKMAVFGAGPAGLTCAHDLALLGYQVTVLEAGPFAGGNMRTAIPSYRLPHGLVDQETRAILELVVGFRPHSPWGPDSIGRLRQEGYDAFFLATGVEKKFHPLPPQEGVFTEAEMDVEGHGIIHAVAAGHRAALAIHQHCQQRALRVEKKGVLVPLDPSRFFDTSALPVSRANPPLAPFPEGGELEEVYNEEAAVEQARRCLRCHIQTVFDGEKCVLCGRCVDICPEKCLKLARLEDLDGDGGVTALVSRLGEASAMIKDETKCIRCGLCQRTCPNQAVTLMAFWFEESLVPA